MELENNFIELTEDELLKLDNEQLKVYYIKLREYYFSLPFNERANKLKKIIHPFILVLMKLAHNLKIEYINDKKIYDGTAIFSVNHTNSHDIPTTCRIIKNHSYVLVENGVEHKDLNGFVLKLNGAIFIDRKSKADRNRSKEDIIKTLLHNNSVIMYPEGTWNMSPNQIMLPLNWGIIDIAKRTDMPIVPIILEYYQGKVLVNIGDPIKVDINDNKLESINKLRDIMATMRWEIWEKLPKLNREEISNDYFEKIINFYLEEYPKLNVEYEKSVILKTHDNEDDVFGFMKNLKPNKNNAFLFRQR